MKMIVEKDCFTGRHLQQSAIGIKLQDSVSQVYFFLEILVESFLSTEKLNNFKYVFFITLQVGRIMEEA